LLLTSAILSALRSCAPLGMSVVPAPPLSGKLLTAWNGIPSFNDGSTSGSDTSPGGAASTPNQKLSSTESDDQGNKANSGQPDGYPRLCAAGPQESRGSLGHPDACNPCAFYCFAARGCRNGGDCSFCHLLHESKLQRRRAEWKMAQRSKRLARKQGSAVQEAEAEGGGPRGWPASFADDLPGAVMPATVAASMRRDPAVNVPSAQAPFPRAMGSDGDPCHEESVMQPVKVQLGMHRPHPGASYPSSLTPGFPPNTGFVGGGITTSAARQMQVPARPSPGAQKPSRDAPSTSLQQMLPGSSVFQYSPSHTVVGVGQLVEIRPPVGLAVSNAIFGISPELPLGVHLDSHTGLILGKPRVGTDGPTTYFVTACTSASTPSAQGHSPLDVSLHISQVSIEVVDMQAAAPHRAGAASGFASGPVPGRSSRKGPAKVVTGWPSMAYFYQTPEQRDGCVGG